MPFLAYILTSSLTEEALREISFTTWLKKMMMMDNSANPNWFSDLVMEDSNFQNDECDIMDYLDGDLCASLGDDFYSSDLNSFIDPNPTLFPSIDHLQLERPSKQLKTNHNNNNQNPSTNIHNFDETISTPFVLTFGNNLNAPEINNPDQQVINIGTLNTNEEYSTSEVLNSQGCSYENLEEAAAAPPISPKPIKKSGGRVRPASQTYDHIIAERKRREILSQRFMALSTLVPGLKKLDKTSVLGDAINYLKYLQERVKVLEEKSMGSVVMVKKSQVIVEDEGSSDEMSGGGGSEEQPLPEIEAKVCNKTLLLRINCEKHKGVLIKILSEVGKFNLDVTNISVAAFGSLALDITIMAEMEQEFNVTTIEVIRTLRSVLLN